METGRLPRGAELLLLGAASGWTGTLTGVRVGGPGLDAPSGQASWGMCKSGDVTVIVTGSPPRVELAGAAAAGPVIGREEIAVTGLERLGEPVITLLHPDLTVDTLVPDSSGRTVMDLDDGGVHWLEITSSEEGGPTVVSLLPLVRGQSLREALEELRRSGGPEVFEAEDVLDEINRLRGGRGRGPLREDEGLEQMARARAVALAESGKLRHLTPEGTGLAEMMRGRDLAYAENIASGSGYSEAWWMILISPTHIASCLSPRFERVGISSAMAADSSGWQLIMVQVFASEETGWEGS